MPQPQYQITQFEDKLAQVFDLEWASNWSVLRSINAYAELPRFPETSFNIYPVKGPTCSCATTIPTKELAVELEAKSRNERERNRWFSIGLGTVALLACFVVGLDDSIISTALSTISLEFDSLRDIGWYGSAYYLPQAVLQPCFGKLYMAWSIRMVYMMSLAIFEVGSLISAFSRSSTILITGRAVSGIGAAGICVGGFNIFANYFSAQEQKLMLGAVAATLAISNALGPILGGILTEHVSWRWCFGINIPIGIVILLGIWIFHPLDTRRTEALSWSWGRKILYLDLPGTALLSTSLTCLLAGVQLVATKTSSHSALVVLFAFSGIAALALVFQQKLRQAESLIPRRIFRQRNIWALGGFLFFLMSSLANHVYFLPIFLQSLFGLSPSASGFRTVPYTVAICITTSITVLAMKYLRYYNPFLISGSVLLAAASALITTLGVHSSTLQVILYQVLAGGGIGFCMLSIVIFPPAVVSEDDIPRAQSIIQMIQTVGQSLSTQITTVVLYRTLRQELESIPLPQATLSAALADLKSLRLLVSVSMLPEVLGKCQLAFQMCFRVGLVAAGMSFILALCLHWKTKTTGDQKSELT